MQSLASQPPTPFYWNTELPGGRSEERREEGGGGEGGGGGAGQKFLNTYNSAMFKYSFTSHIFSSRCWPLIAGGRKKEKEAKVVRCYAFYISVVCAKGVFTVLEYEQNQTDMQITKTITVRNMGEKPTRSV